MFFTTLIAESIGLPADAFDPFFDKDQQHKLKLVYVEKYFSLLLFFGINGARRSCWSPRRGIIGKDSLCRYRTLKAKIALHRDRLVPARDIADGVLFPTENTQTLVQGSARASDLTKTPCYLHTSCKPPTIKAYKLRVLQANGLIVRPSLVRL